MAIFARVVNNSVTEFPVTEEELSQRDVTYDSYLICYIDTYPDIDEFTQYTIPNFVLGNECVFVNYIVKEKTCNQVFESLNLYIENEVSNGNIVSIQTIPFELVNSVMEVTKIKVQNNLDNFAKTRGYDDIKSACSYVASTIDKFRIEGERAIYLRDLTWNNLHTYLKDLYEGNVTVPRTFDDIAVCLPQLTWE